MVLAVSPRMRSVLVVLAALYTAVTAGVCLWDGLHGGCQTQSNIRFHDGAYRVNALAQGGLLDLAGVGVGDEIVAIDGRPCEDLFSLPEELRRVPPGSVVTFRVRRDGHIVDLEVRTWRHLDPAHALLLLLSIMVLMGLGLAVYAARPGARGVGLFLAYCLVVSINTACQATQVAGADLLHRWLTFNYTMLSFYGPPLLLHLFLVFPHRGHLQRGVARWLPLPYLLCFALGLNYLLPTIWADLHELSWMPAVSQGLFYAYGIMATACLGLGALSMVSVAFSRQEYRVRQQARLLFLGFIVLILLQFFLVELPILTRGSPLLDQFTATLPGLVLPVTVAAAIVLHQMFGINILVRHGLVYAVTSAGIALVFALIVGGAGWVVQRFWPFLDMVMVAVAAATAAFLFQPLRARVQDLVDRTLYHRRYDYRQAITEISGRLAGILDTREAIEFIRDRVAALLEPQWLEIVVRPTEGRPFEEILTAEDPREYAAGAAAESLARRLVRAGGVFAPDENTAQPSRRPAWVAPIVRAERALGMLRLGPRKGGVPYLPEDRDFLETLASVAATALERGRLLEERSLRERLALVGSATSSLIHELKNPLAAVKSTVAVLRRRLRDDERGRELTHIVEQEIDRLHDSVIGVLSYVRPRSHEPVPMDLEALLRQAVKVVEPDFQKAGVRIRFHGPASDATIEGDPERLRQLCLNLLLNAREAQPSGGTIDCVLDTWRDERGNSRGIVLQIRDEGCGFRPQVLLHAFDPFFTTKRLGTGLGLVNVKRIVDDHGGQISLANQEKGGASVTIKLPRGGED